MYKRLVVVFLILMSFQHSYSQKGVKTFGFQYKPLIPVNISDFKTSVYEPSDSLTLTSNTLFGSSFGGVLRFGFTDMISLEAGINYVKRNYKYDLFDSYSSISDATTFSIISYEIPIQGLVYVRLSERWYLNAAGGVSIDMFASDVISESENKTFIQYTFTNKMQFALIANFGIEYRTAEKGYFYFGTSFHKPTRDIGLSEVDYTKNDLVARFDFPVKGTYLTLDFRYFFHEDPEKKNKKRKKKD